MPSQLWDLSTREFIDMYEAHIQQVNEDVDAEMQRTSWFTSLLMNASGNMKSRVTPEKLYEPIDKDKPEASQENKQEYIDKQREELRRKFNI